MYEALFIILTMEKREIPYPNRFYEIGFRKLNIPSNWNSSSHNYYCLVLTNVSMPCHAEACHISFCNADLNRNSYSQKLITTV
jgi:hypothetical protein